MTEKLQKILGFGISAMLLFAASACVLRTPATFYTLDTAVPADRVPAAGESPEIPFGKISVPAYTDVSQIIVRDGENTVRRDNSRRWAESLTQAVRRAVPAQTSKLLRGKKLRDLVSVSVFIDRLDGPLDGGIRIEAQIVIVEKNASGKLSSVSRDFSQTVATVPANDSDARYANYVKGVSATIFALSEAIAAQLTAQ